MPAFTTKFLVACRGTSHDAVNQKMTTPPENGGATLEIILENEEFSTFRGMGGVIGFTLDSVAHSKISDPAAVILPGGVGFAIGAQSYAGVLDADGQLLISQAGQ
jgi:hypothetical protein